MQVHGTQPQPEAASASAVGSPELRLRPRSERSGDLVEAVPGLFTAQHAGGGKAHQYFLRGFDADLQRRPRRDPPSGAIVIHRAA